jgi:rhamnogalacturonyl hydrolase YesR
MGEMKGGKHVCAPKHANMFMSAGRGTIYISNQIHEVLMHPKYLKTVRALGLTTVFFAITSASHLPTRAADLSGLTDDSIRAVINLVGNHQIQQHNAFKGTLADGNYAPVYTTTAANAATKPKGIEWEYGWAVTLYGLLQTKSATGSTNFESYAVNHNLILGRYYSWLMSLKTTVTNSSGAPADLSAFYNTTALAIFIQQLDRLDYCGSATSSLLEGALTHSGYVTNEQSLMAQTTANWINYTQSRLPDGTLWRPERFNGTIWADDLYMSCPFLIRWYQYSGNTNFLDDAARQVMNMAGYLQDTDGIWFHGYNVSTNNVNGFKWGRANGWAMVTTAEILSIMPTNHPARSNLLSILTRHIEGVKTVQAPSGMWRQVLDESSLWEETSCTAMFAYSIARAVNRGWMDPTNMTVARKAFAAVCSNISSSGVISNICIGTSIGYNLNFYVTRPRANDDQRGVGAVMLAGAEILLNPRLNIALTNEQAMVWRNAGIPNCILEAATNLTDWSVATNTPTLTTNGLSVVTDSAGDAKFFRLHLAQPAFPQPALEFEAESLAYTTNGATAELSATDINASGGLFVTLFGHGVGDYYEFTITNVPAGTYRLKLSYKASSNRAGASLTVDGNPLGGRLDQYWPTNFYPLVDFGPISFGSTDDHIFRLTTTEKNGASSSYILTADKFLLVPQ